MDNRLNTPWIALRLGIGLTATLAGIDKFFNLLTNWGLKSAIERPQRQVPA